MKIYKKSNSSVYRNFILSILCFAVVIILFMYALTGAADRVENESLENMKKAVNKALVTCYSVEGFYPDNVKYLEDHYAVIIDKNYIVHYQLIGDNIFPSVKFIKVE